MAVDDRSGGPQERMMEAVHNASMPAGSGCCGKPRGCTMTHKGCLYLAHPWKRTMIYGDTSVRCQATGLMPRPDDLPSEHPDWARTDGMVNSQCRLNHGHDDKHEPVPLTVEEYVERSAKGASA